MSDNRRRILDMLAEGKIKADEAERLLAAVDQPADTESVATDVTEGRRRNFKYLRVVVEPADGPDAKQEHVNVRIPAALLRAGIRFASFIPAAAADTVNERLREQGIDLDVRKIKLGDLEQIVDAMGELSVDVHNPKGNVRVFFE